MYSKFFSKRTALVPVALFFISVIQQPVSAQTTYTWTNAAGGAQSWSTAANWSGGVVPEPVAGDVVDFSTLNIAANATLSLGADRTARVWRFGDTSGGQTWAVNSGFTMTLAGTTPTFNIVSSTATLNNAVAGTSGVKKVGTGSLVLAGSNSITGEIEIAAGALTFSTVGAWGGTGKNVDFTGTSTLTTADNYNGGQLSVGTGFTATITAANVTFATATGAGSIVFALGNKTLSLQDASAFQGSIRATAGANGQTIRFGNIGDAVGAGNLQFGGGSGDSGQRVTISLYNDAGPLTLSNRKVEFLPKPSNWSFKTAILENNNSSSANTFVINPALVNLTDRDHEFQLSGSNTGSNLFGGVIGNSTRGTYYNGTGRLSFFKAGAGQWILGGNNTFTGAVTVSAGTLGVSSIDNAASPNPLGLSSASAWNLLLANGATLKYLGGAGSTDRSFTINGSAAGHQATLNASGTGAVVFSNTATPAYGTTAQTRTLILSGTNSGNNTLAALIADNGGAEVSVTKSGTGTWVLTGANTYSGDTTISGGVLNAAEGVGLPASSLLTLNGGAYEPVGNFARVAGNSAGKIRLTGGASGFSARGGDVQVAIGTLGSPAALVMGSATFVPGTLVLNTATADSKLTFLNPVAISGFNLQLSVGAATAEMSGVISGDLTGSVTKIGGGTLILSGNNTAQGNVAVNAGTLSLTQPNLSQYSNVTVANGAVLNLNFAGTTSVASLTLGDVPKAPGAYNSTNAAPFITGTGVIYVNGGDADEDGMPDGWELLYGFNPNDAADAAGDADGDGLTNLEEYVAATGPNVSDTDGDGLTDGQELNGIIVDDELVILGTSPHNPDTDGDGVTDGEEVTAGSSPLLVDTDADGAPDWYEVKASFTNPALASSKPIVPYPLPRPSASAGATNKPVKVFIMSGQSNMVGIGEIFPLGTPGTLSTIVKQQGRFPNFVNADGSWTVNNDVYYRGLISAIGNGPLTVGFGNASTTVGPELGFGRVLGYALDEPVLLIKSSIGNRALGWDYLPPNSPRYTFGANTYAGYGDATQSWLTGSTPVPGSWYAGKQYDECFLNEADWSPTAATLGSPPVDNVVDVLDNFAAQYPQWAAQGFEIAGYVWWQGNKDILTGPPYTTRYETNMVNFIKEIRAYYAARYPGKCDINTPFVLATGCGDPGIAGNGLVVANAQLAAGNAALHPEFAGNVKTMDTRPYWRDASISPDEQGFHYNRNAETYTLTGDALGRGMLELLGGFTDTTAPVLSAVSPATTTTNVATTVNFSATFDEVIIVGAGNILLKNLTDSTSTNIAVTDAAQVTTFGSVLTINPTSYLKPNKQYAIRIPAGAIKDYTGNPFAGINDDTTWTFTTGQGDSLTAALVALTDHINGVSILSSAQIAAHKVTIEGLKDRLGEDEVIIESAFDLVQAYDTVYGALWVASGQMTRSAETGNLQWTVYRVMQGIVDYVYTRGNVVAFPTLINGYKFGSSSNFPGVCAAPSPTATHTVAVNASFLDSFGRDTQQWTLPARRPTGTYLAPGTIATVTVPQALVNAGFKIRVGAHSWDFSNKPYIKRLDRSTLLFDIIGTDTKIASPLGGGIYIETPMNANAGVVNVTITGAARAPFFQNTSFHQTTLAEWLATERTNPAPWADFETDKFMMQVPRSFIYAHPDPLTVLNDWDKSMDAINDLMGFPHIRGKTTMYLQVDVFNRASVYAPGYPTVNNSYSPTTDYGGYLNNYLVRGPQYTPDYTFHEEGHAYFFPKFGGEQESTVNLLYVPVLNQKFGYTMDAAFKRSFGTYNANIPEVGFKDNVAKIWMTSFNFAPREVPMADWEKSYQHQGHAKFVDIAQLYGWGALKNFWYYYNFNDTNFITVPKDNDSLMVKLCESAGADIRPLWHFWGVPPGNAATVASQVSGLGLTPPVEIYDLLMHYKSKLPTDNASFQAFCLLYYGYQPTMGGAGVEREHARQWSTTLLNGTDTQVRFPTEIYDGAAYTAAAARVQEIIDLYYPAGRPPSNNAKLADLQPSLGTLDPGFSGVVLNYSNVVAFSATSMTITPVASDPDATITVNGSPVASGSPSAAINVSAASTNISIVVLSSDNTTTNTYTVTVTHAAASANANLTSLVPSAGTLNPVFASGTTSYTATVPNAVTSLTLTPTVAQSGATITVNGNAVSSGAASGSIALNVGSNIITTVVLAEDQVATKTYTLTVQRTADAGLSSLVPSAGTLAPVFTTTTFGYTAAVSFATSSMTVTPTASDSAASITVNGIAVSSGNTSGAISLAVGSNVITTVVVSQDMSATNTYTLTVTRVAPGSRWWDGGTADIVGNGNGASAGGTGTWDTTLQNWDQGNSLAHMAWDNGNNDTAVFAGTAGTVTIGASVTASGLRFDTASYILSGGTITFASPATITANANATVNSIISSTSGLTKTGGASATLAGNNTIVGGITLNNGTLAFSTLNAWGGTGKNVSFTGSATLTSADNYSAGQLSVGTGLTATITAANVTLATVTGTGNIVFATGNKTLSLADASAFLGNIRTSAGGNGQTIRFATMNDAVGTGNLQFGGGSGDSGQVITLALYNDAGPLTLSNRKIQFLPKPNNWSFKTAILENNNANAANKFVINSALANTTDRDHEFQLSGSNTGNNEFAGQIGNSGAASFYNGTGVLSLIKSGTGKWNVSNSNTFTGFVMVQGGTLVLSGVNAYTGATMVRSGTLTLNSIANYGVDSAIGKPASGNLQLGSSTSAGTLDYIGSASTTNRTFHIGDTTAANTGGGVLSNNGSGALTFTAANFNSAIASITATRTLTLGGTNTDNNSIHGIIQDNVAGTGKINLAKTGAGTWSLSGANSYTGTTAVSAGKLFINGDSTAASGAVSISASATLGGTGTIGGNTSIAASGRLEFDLSTAAAAHDRLDIAAGKSFAFSGASVLTITSSGGAAPGIYTLVTGGNNISGSAPATLNLPAGWTGSVSISGNSLLLNVTSTGLPTLAGIADDKSGGPISMNTLVTYTVSFSEDMDTSTVSAADFGNEGSSAITFGTITETSPGIFTVQVTPTNAGSLQLKINAGAAIKSAAGSDLDTTNAILDDTTLTVQTSYATWSGGAAFNADANGDGLANGMAWLLGAADITANAGALLPIFDNASDANFFIYTYRRSDSANADAGTTIAAEYGSEIGVWSTAVHDGVNIIITPTNDGAGVGVDSVQVKIKRTLAVGGKIFIRLKTVFIP